MDSDYEDLLAELNRVSSDQPDLERFSRHADDLLSVNLKTESSLEQKIQEWNGLAMECLSLSEEASRLEQEIESKARRLSEAEVAKGLRERALEDRRLITKEYRDRRSLATVNSLHPEDEAFLANLRARIRATRTMTGLSWQFLQCDHNKLAAIAYNRVTNRAKSIVISNPNMDDTAAISNHIWTEIDALSTNQITSR